MFLPYSIHTEYKVWFQDIALLNDKLFYHPYGPWGLYEYDLKTNKTRLLVDYAAGDHIATDSNFVFADIDHYTIWKYDLSKDSAKEIIRFKHLFSNIGGLDTYNGKLYVYETQTNSLNVYTYDGELLSTFSIPFNPGYYMTIIDGVAYFNNYFETTITRIDLKTMTKLPSIRAPVWDMSGMKFYNGYLYFCDYKRRLVGRVPVADLTSVK